MSSVLVFPQKMFTVTTQYWSNISK